MKLETRVPNLLLEQAVVPFCLLRKRTYVLQDQFHKHTYDNYSLELTDDYMLFIWGCFNLKSVNDSVYWNNGTHHYCGTIYRCIQYRTKECMDINLVEISDG